MKSLVRDAKNRFFYDGAENLVRDATSNNNDLPSPLQLKKIGDACLYPDSYILIFAQLHKRLTHLEYKRHVVKSLLVLDHLIRLKPPSLSVQLKLIVDIREHWNDVYRLAKLRTQSSSTTIQQIQRVAERLCEFIFRFEQGDIKPGGADGENESSLASPKAAENLKTPKKKPATIRKKKKLRRAPSDSSSSSSSDSDDSNSGAEGGSSVNVLDLLSPSRIPNFKPQPGNAGQGANALATPAVPTPSNAPAVSPFGFDFGFWSDGPQGGMGPRGRSNPNYDLFADLGSHSHNKNWHAPPPGWGVNQQQQQPVLPPPHMDWICAKCTYMNPSDQPNCVMCHSPRKGPNGMPFANPGPNGQRGSQMIVITPPTGASSSSVQGWACKFCSFLNAPSNKVCHVCDHPRSSSADLNDPNFRTAELEKQQQRNMNTDGSFGDQRGGGMNEEKKEQHAPNLLLSPPRTLGRTNGNGGGISCSWCQYLNPSTAIKCEICDKDLIASSNAQRLKLQMAHQVEAGKLPTPSAAAVSAHFIQQQRASGHSWQCPNCTHINGPNSQACVRCRFNPMSQIPGGMQTSSFQSSQPGAAYPPGSGLGNPFAPPQHHSAAGRHSMPGPLPTFNNGPSSTSNPNLLTASPSNAPRNGSFSVNSSSFPVSGHKPSRSAVMPAISQSSVSMSVPSSTSVSANNSRSNSPYMRPRAGSTTSNSSSNGGAAGSEYQPDTDLLELLAEQGEGADLPVKRADQVLEQVQALSAYNELAEELKGGKWQCRHCSYLNFPQDKECEMCQHARSGGTGMTTSGNDGFDAPVQFDRSMPLVAHPQPVRTSVTSKTTPPQAGRQQPQATKPAPTTNPFDLLQPLGAEHALPTRSQNKAAAAQAEIAARPSKNRPSQSLPNGDWACAQCTYVNAATKLICGMCDLPRGSAKDPSLSPPQHSPTHSGRTSNAVSREPSPGVPNRQLSPNVANTRAMSVSSATTGNGSAAAVVNDPYSALLSGGASGPARMNTGSVSGVAGVDPYSSIRGSSVSGKPSGGVAALAPPNQPSRHRSSTSTPSNSRTLQPDQAAAAAAAAAGFAPVNNSGPVGSKRVVPNTAANIKLPNPPQGVGKNDRDSSFNSFEPSFPQPDAFSHLHPGTGLKSPPALTPTPTSTTACATLPPSSTTHQRNLSFGAMFALNADLFAKQVVGHVPAPGGEQKKEHEALLNAQAQAAREANALAQQQQQQKEAAAASQSSPHGAQRTSVMDPFGEVDGEFQFEPVAPQQQSPEDDVEEEVPRKRTKEEKEAHRREKAEKRARKEAKRVAKAALAVEAERKRLEDLSLQAAAAAKQDALMAQQMTLTSPKQPQPQSPALPIAQPVVPTSKPSPPPIIVPPVSSPKVLNKPSPPAPVNEKPTTPKQGGVVTAAPPAAGPPSLPTQPPVSVPLDQAALRQKVIDEIKSTEKLYVDALFDVINHFMEPMKKLSSKLGVTPKQIGLIFSNLTVLAQFHSLFLADLNKCKPASPNAAVQLGPDESIVEVFVQLSPFLKMTAQYCNNYEKSIATINSLRTNTKFQKFLEEQRDLLKGRGLMTFLIMPVQRIPRYVLLLRELKRHTPVDHIEYDNLNSALTKIEAIAEHINESKRHVENMSKLLDIQNRLQDKKFVLFKPDRRLLREGMLKRLKEDYVLNDSSMRAAQDPVDMVDQLVFLFNDLFLWTTPTFDITGSVELSKLQLLPNQTPRMPHTISLGVKGQPYSPEMVFLCRDQEEYEQWSRYLEAAILTANELSAHPGVRLIQAQAGSGGGGGSSGTHTRGPSANMNPSPSPAPPTAGSPPMMLSAMTSQAAAAAAVAASLHAHSSQPSIHRPVKPSEHQLELPVPQPQHHAHAHELEL